MPWNSHHSFIHTHQPPFIHTHLPALSHRQSKHLRAVIPTVWPTHIIPPPPSYRFGRVRPHPYPCSRTGPKARADSPTGTVGGIVTWGGSIAVEADFLHLVSVKCSRLDSCIHGKEKQTTVIYSSLSLTCTFPRGQLGVLGIWDPLCNVPLPHTHTHTLECYS